MGCDIHLVLERKYGLKWIAVDTFRGHETSRNDWASPLATSRNYERFAALAGVRGDGPQPRGAPSDISDTTAMLLEDWAGDAHSTSWLPLPEASQVFLATEHGEVCDFAKKYPQSHFFNIAEEDKHESHRLVFWFDN